MSYKVDLVDEVELDNIDQRDGESLAISSSS